MTPTTATLAVTNGIPTISFTGTPNSTNVTDGSGFWQVTDPNATNNQQFYRSYQPVP